MYLNADDSQRIALNHITLDWLKSPQTGVERRLLERTGYEVAKATSVVRYQPGAMFDSHTHEFGEEILVLEGALSDEPAGLITRTTQ